MQAGTLPEGPHSILAAFGNLCALKKTVTVGKRVVRRVHGQLRHVTVKVKKTVPAALVMPTTISGQNGAQGSRGCAEPSAENVCCAFDAGASPNGTVAV